MANENDTFEKDYRQFADNLPFMYARYKVIRDENGFITDSYCTDANSFFRDYYKSVDPIGKRRSELLKESNPFWIHHATRCLTKQATEIWQYNGTSLGELNVVMKPIDEDTLDVYTINMDADRRMEHERRMEYHEIMKAKYLCGVKIWHWRLDEDKIYSKETLYGEDEDFNDFDEKRGYLMWKSEVILGRVKDPAERKAFDEMIESLKAGQRERGDIYVHMHAGGQVVLVIVMMMVEEFDRAGNAISIMGCTRIASIQ